MCGYCVKAKEYFKKKGLSFIEVDVTKDSSKGQEIFKRTGQYSVPMILIDGKVILGFDIAKINEALGSK